MKKIINEIVTKLEEKSSAHDVALRWAYSVQTDLDQDILRRSDIEMLKNLTEMAQDDYMDQFAQIREMIGGLKLSEEWPD